MGAALKALKKKGATKAQKKRAKAALKKATKDANKQKLSKEERAVVKKEEEAKKKMVKAKAAVKNALSQKESKTAKRNLAKLKAKQSGKEDKKKKAPIKIPKAEPAKMQKPDHAFVAKAKRQENLKKLDGMADQLTHIIAGKKKATKIIVKHNLEHKADKKKKTADWSVNHGKGAGKKKKTRYRHSADETIAKFDGVVDKLKHNAHNLISAKKSKKEMNAEKAPPTKP